MRKKKSLQLINTIKNLLLKKNLLQPNQSVLLSISGGQDSIFLLIIIYILKKQWNLTLYVFYCNHLWQKNTFYTYLHISKISFCLKINVFYSITLKELNSEEQGRFWRSKNYYRLIEFSNCLTILTGHTLTDHIETYFFNTIRGSGFKGSFALQIKQEFSTVNKNKFPLSECELIKFKNFKKSRFKNGIQFKKIQSKRKTLFLKNKFNIYFEKALFYIPKKRFSIVNKKRVKLKILRPLIKKTRFDTKKICISWKLPIFPDQTNKETRYSRNRLRKQILPIFRFFFNPKVDLSLYRHSEIFLDEDFYQEKLIIKLTQKLVNEDTNGYFFNLLLFCSVTRPLQRKICYNFFKEKLRVNYSFQAIESFLVFTNKFFAIIRKKKKLNLGSNKILCIFIPELGTIFFSNTLFLFLK